MCVLLCFLNLVINYVLQKSFLISNSTLANYDDELRRTWTWTGHCPGWCNACIAVSSCRPSPVAPVMGRFRCSSLNLRLSCRRSNWETRTCPCTDFGHCPAVQLNVFVRTSARTWSCIRWADRTGSSMCLSCNRNGKRETERGIKIIRVETETRIRKINNCRKFSCGLRS